MKPLLSLMLLLPVHGWAQSPQDSLKELTLEASQMQEDFALYRRVLQETHPGLYRYVSKGQMQVKFDSITELIQEPLPFYDFYRILAALNADIRCAHSSVMSTKNIQKYMANNIKAFPLFLFPIDGKLFLLFNGTTDQTLKPGFELTQINHHRIDSIVKILKRHFWADGYNELSKNPVLQGSLFGLFYYTIIERPDSFHVTLKDPEGGIVTSNILAQTLSVTERNYSKNPVNKQMLKFYNKKFKNPWRLEFVKDPKSIAILRFDSFGKTTGNSEDGPRIAMREFMDEALQKIEKRKTEHLIVDVRSNSGGWDTQGVELFTYLMKSDNPVRYYKRQYAITDSSEFLRHSDLSEEDIKNLKQTLKAETDGTFSLTKEGNSDLKIQYPKPNQFKGKVYVLMNERSFSTTAEFLAVAKSNDIGVFVGEESGGAYEGGNGGSFINMALPNSKITINTPLVYYENAVKPSLNKGRGTTPDHEVSFQLEDLLNHYDRQLEFVKDLIRKEIAGTTH